MAFGKKPNVLSIPILALVGCGAQRQAEPVAQPAAVSRGEGDAVCRTETPTGNHLQQTRCYRSEDAEQTREAARRALDRP
jgi:hypothetical protein